MNTQLSITTVTFFTYTLQGNTQRDNLMPHYTLVLREKVLRNHSEWFIHLLKKKKLSHRSPPQQESTMRTVHFHDPRRPVHHRIGRDLSRSPSPTPLSRQGHLEQVTDTGTCPGGFGMSPEKVRLHELLDQPVPLLYHPQWREVLPQIEVELL